MKYLSLTLKWIAGILLLALIGIIIFLHTIDFSPSEDYIEHSFSAVQYKPEYKSFQYKGRNMHYVSIGDSAKQSIMFVHGSPGSWDNFLGFMADSSLLNDFRIISVDRPGFGKSGDGSPERSLSAQSDMISQVLRREHTTAVLIGHSFGGPVIVQMAVDNPDLVDGLVIVAGSVDPDLEKTRWYQIPVHYKAFSWILPDMLYSTNEEIIALKAELEKLSPYWSDIQIPVSVIQGGSDDLVPKENADYAEEMLINTKPHMVRVPDMNHFVPWTNPELIIAETHRINDIILNN